MQTRRSVVGTNPLSDVTRWFAVAVCVATTLAVFSPRVSGQSATAVVAGAPRVFVRRGPGTEFPPFATLTEGSPVEVQQTQGEWARIATANGQVGYVNITFLNIAGERSRAAVSPVRAPTAAAATPAARVETASVHVLTERNKELEAQVANLQQQLSELQARVEAAPTPAPPGQAAGDSEQLRTQMAHLTTAVEGLQRQLVTVSLPPEPAPGGNSAADSPHFLSPGAVLLGMLGILLGWLIGSGYGRRLERGRRSRIRL